MADQRAIIEELTAIVGAAKPDYLPNRSTMITATLMPPLVTRQAPLPLTRRRAGGGKAKRSSRLPAVGVIESEAVSHDLSASCQSSLVRRPRL
jgi:hypothetical protein